MESCTNGDVNLAPCIIEEGFKKCPIAEKDAGLMFSYCWWPHAPLINMRIYIQQRTGIFQISGLNVVRKNSFDSLRRLKVVQNNFWNKFEMPTSRIRYDGLKNCLEFQYCNEIEFKNRILRLNIQEAKFYTEISFHLYGL